MIDPAALLVVNPVEAVEQEIVQFDQVLFAALDGVAFEEEVLNGFVAATQQTDGQQEHFVD